MGYIDEQRDKVSSTKEMRRPLLSPEPLGLNDVLMVDVHVFQSRLSRHLTAIALYQSDQRQHIRCFNLA